MPKKVKQIPEEVEIHVDIQKRHYLIVLDMKVAQLVHEMKNGLFKNLGSIYTNSELFITDEGKWQRQKLQ
jgi:hypothetical protein